MVAVQIQARKKSCLKWTNILFVNEYRDATVWQQKLNIEDIGG